MLRTKQGHTEKDITQRFLNIVAAVYEQWGFSPVFSKMVVEGFLKEYPQNTENKKRSLC